MLANGWGNHSNNGWSNNGWGIVLRLYYHVSIGVIKCTNATATPL